MKNETYSGGYGSRNYNNNIIEYSDDMLVNIIIILNIETKHNSFIRTCVVQKKNIFAHLHLFCNLSIIISLKYIISIFVLLRIVMLNIENLQIANEAS